MPATAKEKKNKGVSLDPDAPNVAAATVEMNAYQKWLIVLAHRAEVFAGLLDVPVAVGEADVSVGVPVRSDTERFIIRKIGEVAGHWAVGESWLLQRPRRWRRREVLDSED